MGVCVCVPINNPLVHPHFIYPCGGKNTPSKTFSQGSMTSGFTYVNVVTGNFIFKLLSHTHTPVKRPFVQDYPGELGHRQVCISFQTDNHARTRCQLLSVKEFGKYVSAQMSAQTESGKFLTRTEQ